jgi:hypothetical protein
MVSTDDGAAKRITCETMVRGRSAEGRGGRALLKRRLFRRRLRPKRAANLQIAILME